MPKDCGNLHPNARVGITKACQGSERTCGLEAAPALEAAFAPPVWAVMLVEGALAAGAEVGGPPLLAVCPPVTASLAGAFKGCPAAGMKGMEL